MKKVFMLSLYSMMMHAQAHPSFCGYKDYFHLNDPSHPGIFIYTGYSEQDLILQFIGPKSFILRDAAQCRTGYAHITVAYDIDHWCVLDIKDGPRMSHPKVSASCNGIQYLGTEYDGFNSYSYTINLN